MISESNRRVYPIKCVLYPVDCCTVLPLYNGSTCVPTRHHSPCIHQHQLVAAPLYLQEGKDASIKAAKQLRYIHNVQRTINIFQNLILIRPFDLGIQHAFTKCPLTFWDSYQLPWVDDPHVSVGSMVGVHLLILHLYHKLLATDHMTKHHVNAVKVGGRASCTVWGGVSWHWYTVRGGWTRITCNKFLLSWLTFLTMISM